MSALQCHALGRPFQLGMLYNMPSDTLITGLSLWDKKVLEASTSKSNQVSCDFDISTKDSMDERMKHFGVGADLSLSIAVGLVKVGGSAKYLYNSKASSSIARVTLRYSCTSFFEQLTMEQLGNVQYPQMLEKQDATHVVTGIEYGADAFFVFEKEMQRTENRHEIQGKMKLQIARIPKIVAIPPDLKGSGEVKSTEELESFSCTFYGDVLPNENPASVQEAIKLYKRVSSFLGNNYENTVPKVVHLTPLSELDQRGARVARKISDSLVKQTHWVIESFESIESRTHLLLKNESVGKFVNIGFNLERFKRTVVSIKGRFISRLVDVIPRVRSGISDEGELAGIMSTTSKLYFESRVFSMWLESKEQEVKCLEQYLDMTSKVEGLNYEFGRSSFELFVNDPRCKSTVISFHFRVAAERDPWLDQLTEVIKSAQPLPDTFECLSASKWMGDPKIVSNLKEKMHQFLGLVRANAYSCREEKVRFVVTDSSEKEGIPADSKGAVLMLHRYNQPSVELKPPGKPGKPLPVEKSITHCSVQLEWKQPVCESVDCIAARYRVCYRRVRDPADEWTIVVAGTNKAEISSLSSNVCYVFKVLTDCGYFLGEESEWSDALTTSPSVSSQFPEFDSGRVLKRLRKISLPAPTAASSRDTEQYRRGYPGKQDDVSVNHNFEFYTNRRKSHPDGDFIDNIHKQWWGNYKLLDSHSEYIQWLFPIREKGTNSSAKELQPHEVKKIRRDPEATRRFLTSYEMMLDVYGLKLTDKQTGKVERSRNWRERFANLNHTSRLRNLQIITRILKSLGEFGFEQFKVPLIGHLMHAAIMEGTLEYTLTSCMIYWVEVVKDDGDRERLHQYARELIQRTMQS